VARTIQNDGGIAVAIKPTWSEPDVVRLFEEAERNRVQ
jgi:hypothetical protein